MSIGVLNEDGVASMIFGEKSVDYSDLMAELFKDNINGNIDNPYEIPQNEEAQSSNISLASIAYGGGGSGGTTRQSIGEYTYVGSASSKWLSKPGSPVSIAYAPDNSKITNYTSKYTIILDTYKGNYDNSSINRVWTNSETVKSYLGAQTCGAYYIYSWFGSNSANINITNVGPANGTAKKIPNYYDYVAKYLNVGNYWSVIKPVLNWSFETAVDVAEVSSLQKFDRNFNRYYQKGKYIKRVNKQADVLYQPSDLTAFSKNGGGASFIFDYTYYAKNKNLTSGAQVMYSVYKNGGHTYYWSDKVYNRWVQ